MSFSDEKMEEKIQADPVFAGLVRKYGKPLTLDGDCSTKNPGDVCMRSPKCIDHLTLVMICDNSEGCDDYREDPC